ncbi:MAG: sigma-70 family RNA polymerase sigma factor [Prevotella sp.]|nr:sigma-70 family RNA polymerase sigma factor [Prevotella sp.]
MNLRLLIERCRQGDEEALGELYEAYSQQMRGICRRYFSDEQTIDDVLHDAFVIIFTSFDRLRDMRRAEPWMNAIVRNVASKYKDHLRAHPTISIEEANETELPIVEAEANDAAGIPHDDLMQLLNMLPEGYSKVLRLSIFEGLSHKEIAALMNIEPHSSSSQLSRAKRMLRKLALQYWAILLLLLVPIFWLVNKNKEHGETSQPIVKRQQDIVQEEEKTTPTKVSKTTLPHIPIAKNNIRPLIISTTDTITPIDSLAPVVAKEEKDTTVNVPDEKPVHQPIYDVENMLADKWENNKEEQRKWSLDLTYSGNYDTQNRYNQLYAYQLPPRNQQDMPGPGAPTYIEPSSIDNWNDYLLYLERHPEAVNQKVREVISTIALNNANQPANEKILRTSHHYMPLTWSLSLTYKLNHHWGFETGLKYSKLTSEFEKGTDGNTINERQVIHYLGIPLKGVYHLYDNNRWSVYGAAGFTIEKPVYSPLYTDYYVRGRLELNDKTTIHAPWQLSTSFGVGLQYHITPYIGFFAEPSMQYYIPMKTNIETYHTEHPFSFTLPLGIRFTW